MRVPVERVTLTARLKADLVDVDEAVISGIHRLLEEYSRSIGRS